jgi:hypothetical protein
MRCKAYTKNNRQCKLDAKYNDDLCGVHHSLKQKGFQINYFTYITINNTLISEKIKVLDDDVTLVDAITIGEEKEEIFNINNNDLLDALSGKYDKFLFPIDRIIECQCCFCEYDRDECVWCDKWSDEFNHIYCKTCINTYFDIHVKDGDASLTCPCNNSDKCEGKLKMHDLERIIDNNITLDKLNDIIQHMEVLNMSKVLSNYYICPFCQRYGCVVDNNNIKNIKCERCNKKWCKKCKQLDHDGECGVIGGNFNKEIINHIVEECISDSLLHSCPVCSTKYTKTYGCNLMTCPKCKSYSCYICGMMIVPRGNIKYWHFRGSGSADFNASCPLYNYSIGIDVEKGNNKYNKERISQACKNLYDINTDIKVRKEIVKILKKHNINIINNKKSKYPWYKRLFKFFGF